jgi:hypothetical protein
MPGYNPAVRAKRGFKMRTVTAIAALLLVSATAQAADSQTETPVTPDDTAVPITLSVVQPVNPVGSKPGAPILQSISARLMRSPAGVVEQLVPDFHYIAPNGNAVVLHRELVDSSNVQLRINSVAPINAPPDVQKRGAVVSGGWHCGPEQYYATLKAYIMDADGNRSNTVQYTIHCNGG